MNWTLEEALLYYKKQGAPTDQNALIALLREIQQEFGSIPPGSLKTAAEFYGIRETLLTAMIRRIPRLRLENTHILELCGGNTCPKRANLAAFLEKTYGPSPKTFTLRTVPCMRLCGRGPNIRWDGTVYHQADEALLRRLIGEDAQ